MGWKDTLRNVFSRGHKDIYEAAKKYAQERGVPVTDVVASAMASYLAADKEGADILEETMTKRRTSGGGGGAADVTAAVTLFTNMADSMSKMFDSVNTLRASVSIGSIVSDFETVTTAVQRIKGMGTDAGKGSLEDKLADSFIRGIIARMAGGLDVGGTKKKKTRTTGESEVEELEQ